MSFKKTISILGSTGSIGSNTVDILAANKKDVAKAKKIKTSMIDRLILDSNKINLIRKSIYEIIKFKDPVGKTLSSWKRPNGLLIKRISIPIGTIGIIYESRPNVTADVAALCFKSGNAVILRGGSNAFYSNKILSNLFRKALKKRKCNQKVKTTFRGQECKKNRPKY